MGTEKLNSCSKSLLNKPQYTSIQRGNIFDPNSLTYFGLVPYTVLKAENEKLALFYSALTCHFKHFGTFSSNIEPLLKALLAHISIQ